MTSHTSWRLGALLAAAATAPLLIGHAALAQTEPAAVGRSTDIAEVVVTAARREQSLSKVTESVSAFTSQKMDIEGIKTFADLSKYTPGIAYDPESHDISIRGIQSTAGSGTTGVYIDDTPVQVRNLGLNANNTVPVVFDLQRVEVLRGPQGTLFGAGSEGGTVRYITTQPSLTTFSGMAHAEVADTYSGAPSYEFGAAFGGPIVEDKLGFRISAWGRRDGGYIDRVDYQTLDVTQANANWVDTYALRAAATWAPTPNLTITPSIDYQKRDQNNYDNYWVGISEPDDGRFLNGTPDRQPDHDRFWMPALRVEWDSPEVKVISNTAYYDRKELVGGYSGTLYNLSYFQHYLTGDPNQQSVWGEPALPAGDINGNAIPCPNNCGNLYPLINPNGMGPDAGNLGPFANYMAWNTITNAQQNFTQEIRVQSANPSRRLQWVVGMFYAFDRQQSNEQIFDPELPQLTEYLWGVDMPTAWGENLLPNGVDYDNDTRAHDRQIALFADATYNITDQLKLELGVRYAWTKFAFLNTNDGPQDLLCYSNENLDGSCAPNLNTGGKSEKPFTPKISLSYQLTGDDMVYATVSKGYRIGGATPPLPVQACGGQFPDQYNSDTVWNYEIGTKDRFFDRKLYVAASLYYIRWFDIQQAFYVPLCGIQYTTNAGQAVSKGFDFQSQWQVTSHLSLEGTAGYTDAYFTRTSFDVDGNLLDEAGDGLDVAPWTVSLGAQYDFKIADHDSFARIDYEFASKRTRPIPNEDPNTAYYDPALASDPATNQVSARAGVNFGRWDLAVYVYNMLNAHPQLNLNHEDSATTLYEASTLRPRTFGLAANVKF